MKKWFDISGECAIQAHYPEHLESGIHFISFQQLNTKYRLCLSPKIFFLNVFLGSFVANTVIKIFNFSVSLMLRVPKSSASDSASEAWDLKYCLNVIKALII